MTQQGPIEDRLTDYERAICYFALPKIISPVTLGLIAAYAVCVLEALAVLLYGLVSRRAIWIESGAWALAGIMIFGIAAFLGRAFLNEYRQRRLLAAARGVPNAPREAGNLPDPFAGHVLLCHPAGERGARFECSGRDSKARYLIEVASRGKWRIVRDAAGEEVCRVHVVSGPPSFMISMGVPSKLEVFQKGEVIAKITRRFSFSTLDVTIRVLKPAPVDFAVRGQTLYVGGVMAGRIYELRRSIYLDIKREAFNEAILGFFATLS